MTKQNNRKTDRRVRSIRSRRDFDGASSIATRLAKDAERDTATDLRLQQLLKELDKFDPMDADEEPDFSLNDDFARPGRRWSDDASDSD